MKRSALISILCILSGVIVGQSKFVYGQSFLTIIASKTYPKGVSFKEPVADTDDEWVKLFKGYFNPGSFESYKSFFLARDWGGQDITEYDSWQKYLHSHKYSVETIHHVKDQQGNEFLVFQTTMETSQFIMPNSMILKKVNSAWKHISMVNDANFAMLKKFGEIRTSVLSEQRNTSGNINLANTENNDQRQMVEKFDRKSLFQIIETRLKLLKISQSDINHVKGLFLSRKEHLMISYLTSAYPLESYQLMREINVDVGFPFFTILSTRDTK